MMPTIKQQIATMRAAWPTLRLERSDDRRALWRGPLRPSFSSFEVSIAYMVPSIVELIDPLRQQPRVRVVDPVLRQRRGDTEGDLPHVYWDDPVFPSLCLFDHEAGEWTPFDLLSETTVKWTIDWLACYEGWRTTGKWAGGGRHLETARRAG